MSVRLCDELVEIQRTVFLDQVIVKQVIIARGSKVVALTANKASLKRLGRTIICDKTQHRSSFRNLLLPFGERRNVIPHQVANDAAEMPTGVSVV